MNKKRLLIFSSIKCVMVFNNFNGKEISEEI